MSDVTLVQCFLSAQLSSSSATILMGSQAEEILSYAQVAYKCNNTHNTYCPIIAGEHGNFCQQSVTPPHEAVHQ